jgi:uncharacterized coiled-coil protein SlyX
MTKIEQAKGPAAVLTWLTIAGILVTGGIAAGRFQGHVNDEILHEPPQSKDERLNSAVQQTEDRVLDSLAVQNGKIEQLAVMVYELTTSQAVLTERLSALVDKMEDE